MLPLYLHKLIIFSISAHPGVFFIPLLPQQFVFDYNFSCNFIKGRNLSYLFYPVIFTLNANI